MNTPFLRLLALFLLALLAACAPQPTVALPTASPTTVPPTATPTLTLTITPTPTSTPLPHPAAFDEAFARSLIRYDAATRQWRVTTV